MANEPIENRLLDVLAINSVSTPVAVNAGGTSWSKSFILSKKSNFGLEYRMASPGVVNVQIDLEIGNVRPATEGTTDADWVVSSGIDAGVVDENLHFEVCSPKVALYGRFKFTGLAGNDAGTTCDRLRIATTETS